MRGRQAQVTQPLPGHAGYAAIGALTALLARRSFRLLLSAVLLAAILGTVAWAVLPALAGRDEMATTKWYGAASIKVQAAVQAAGWPQQKNNWCGVATIAAIARFRGHSISQTDVANFLNSSAAVSAWGTAPRSSSYWGPGFQADISGDVGTDPRSLAEGLTVEAQGSYHQLVDPGTNYDATASLVADLVRTGEPISVIVFHGLHSVLVSAVEATGNPVTDFGSILGLDVWDPGYGIPGGNIQPRQLMFVPINTWLTSTYYWGPTYSANYYGSIAEDPDPVVGPYSNIPSLGDDVHIWVTHFVYLRQDASTASDIGVSADWAIAPGGAVIEGEHGELPQVSGNPYTGPKIVLPVVQHLVYTSSAYTSIDGPALWTNSTYPAVPGSPLPMGVLAWTGIGSQQYLNVSTSTNGWNYGNHITLGDTAATRPGVLALQVGTRAVVVLAWVGANAAHSLNVLYDVYNVTGARKLLTMTASSSYAPSLAYFNNQVWMAWIGIDTNHTVNIEPLSVGSTGLTPGASKTVSFAHSTQAPDLASDAADGTLLLSWEDPGSIHHLDSASSSDGVTWVPGVEASSTLASVYTPGLLEGALPSTSSPPTQVAYVWSWTVEDRDHSVDIMYLANLTTWSGPVTYMLVSSLGTPALGYIGASQELLLAWTDTTGRGIDLAVVPAYAT